MGFCSGRDREKEELEAGCPLGSSRRACSEVLAEAGCHLHSSEVFFKRLGHTLQKPKQPPSPPNKKNRGSHSVVFVQKEEAQVMEERGSGCRLGPKVKRLKE